MEDFLFKDRNIIYNILCVLISENEKFFDRSDSNLYWRTVFHLTVLGHHSYIASFAMGLDLMCSDAVEIVMLRRFRAGYLTGWNFMFQTTFLFLALTHDVLEWCDKDGSRIGKQIKYWRDILFCGLVVPVTVFVAAMFWSVYTIDRELVFPVVYDQIVPWWFNHCVHTNIFIIICVETILQARRRPLNERLETTLVVTCVVSYAVVYYSIYFFAHRWLYEVFGVMTWWQVCLFQCLIWASAYLFYRAQFPINRLFHGSGDEVEITKSVASAENVVTNETSMTEGRNGKVNGKIFTEGTMVDENDDLRKAPFVDKSWSKKYRSLRSQFEKSNL